MASDATSQINDQYLSTLDSERQANLGNTGPLNDFDDDPGYFTFGYAENAFQLATALFGELGEGIIVPDVPIIRDFPLPELTAAPIIIPQLSDPPELEPLPDLTTLRTPEYEGAPYAAPGYPPAPPPVGEITIADVTEAVFEGTGYQTPAFYGVNPVIPIFPGVPQSPPLDEILAAPLDPVPVLDDIPVDLIFPPAPGDFSAIAPDQPNLQEPTVPDPPDDTLPNAPALADIVLPEAPEIFIPTLTAALGPAPTPDDVPTFQFDDEDYGSELLTALQNKLNYFLSDNTTGLAEVIWQSIWERAREREDLTAVKAREEVDTLFASRGFSLPPGAQAKRVDMILQGNQDAANSLSRDQAIEEAKLEVENVRFAVTQGIQLEIALIDNFNQAQQRALEVARLTVELAVRVFEAQVSAYNAQVVAFRAQVEAYRAEIEAEISKIQIFTAEVAAQRTIVELNNAQIANYRAQIDAVVATYDLYRAQLDAARFVLDQNRLRIEEFQALTQAYAVEAQVLSTEADIFQTRVNSERLKIDLRGSNVAAYSAQVQAFDALSNARSRIKEQEIAVERFKIENFASEIEGARLAIDSINAQLQASVSVFDSQIRRFGSEVDGEARRVTAEVEKFRGDVEAYRTEVQAEVEQGRISIEAANQAVALFEGEVRLHASRSESESNRVNSDVARFAAETNLFAASARRDTDLASAGASRAQAAAAIYGAEVGAFSAQVSADASRYGADISKYGADVNAFTAISAHDVNRARVVTEELTAKLGVISERIIAGARIAGQIAASALSTHSWAAVRSVSDSWSQSWSTSQSANFTSQAIAQSVYSCDC